jgi:hypothetical protein
MNSGEGRSGAGSIAGRFGYWRGLLWCEWYVHARLVLVFLFGWLAAVWVLPFVAHPLWILMAGVGFAFAAGPAFGGSDVIHGCEEFTFGLPVTRGERFLARLAVGFGCLLALTLMNVVALESKLADVLLRVFLDAGLGGLEVRRPELLYGLVFAFPFAVFAIGFGVAALTTRRTVAVGAWIWGALGALAIVRAGAFFEQVTWDRLTGRITVPSLLAGGLATLAVSYHAYGRKEASAGGTPLRMPLSWWGSMALLVLAALATAALLGWVAANFIRLL